MTGEALVRTQGQRCIADRNATRTRSSNSLAYNHTLTTAAARPLAASKKSERDSFTYEIGIHIQEPLDLSLEAAHWGRKVAMSTVHIRRIESCSTSFDRTAR
jgi:hypothetical protein